MIFWNEHSDTMPVCKMKHSPVFFIGMPRSGTTIVFEKFVESPMFGWLSNYSEMYPSFPFINLLCPLLNNRFINLQGHKKQYGKVRFGNRYLPQAVEAYAFWDRYARDDFSCDFLLQDIATEKERENVHRAVNSVLKYQMKDRFATKLTGPGRISYLKSIFPDARFIHVVRDGRAVVGSLMKVDFWKGKGGFDGPFWNNGLTEKDLQPWVEMSHPAVITAIEWVKVVAGIRHDSSLLENGQYIEVRYEDFIQNPEQLVADLYRFVGVQEQESPVSEPQNRTMMANRNKNNFTDIDSDIVDAIEAIMSTTLKDFGYGVA